MSKWTVAFVASLAAWVGCVRAPLLPGSRPDVRDDRASVRDGTEVRDGTAIREGTMGERLARDGRGDTRTDGSQTPTWIPGFSFRRLIDVADAQVAGAPHANFPLLISTVLPELRTTTAGGKVTDAQGDDIIFAGADGTTLLAHELERYAGATGEVIAWVRVPALASSSTLYLYYGNSAVTSFQGKLSSGGVVGVWDASYQGVWHLGGGPTLALLDSSAHGRDGTNNGATAASGQIGGAAGFDGTAASVTAPDLAGGLGYDFAVGASFTVSAWIRPTTTTGGQPILLKEGGLGPNWAFEIALWGSKGELALNKHNGGTGEDVISAAGITAGVFSHVAAVKNGTTVTFFINGALTSGDVAWDNQGPTDWPLTIGGRPSYLYSSYFGGVIDEPRVMSTARSAGWILTEYRNQSSPSSFYTIGSEETSP